MTLPEHISIIIPTHNRSGLLVQSLEALERQSWPASRFDVCVVADACKDDTVEAVARCAGRVSYRLECLRHETRSASATRHLGATHARGDTLLFLDDDVIAQPRLVQAHAEAQQPRGIVLGYSKPVLPRPATWWQQGAHRWWEDRFRAMGQPGHRFTYADLFSGNLSLPAALYRQVGGFNLSRLGRLEDHELGIRLLQAGARFRFVPEALGYHHDHCDLGRWLRDLRREGAAHVEMGERHPELRPLLFNQVEPASRGQRWLRHLAFSHPAWGDRVERGLFHLAMRCEQLRLRGHYQHIIVWLREYNEWRGVAEAIGRWDALTAWLQEGPVAPALACDAPLIDLAALPPAGELASRLERASRSGLRLAIDGVEVLSAPPSPDAEPLRPEHLPAILRESAQRQFIPGLALHLVRADLETGLLC